MELTAAIKGLKTSSKALSLEVKSGGSVASDNLQPGWCGFLSIASTVNMVGLFEGAR